MKYLLDTNIVSEIATPNSPFRETLNSKTASIRNQDLSISSLTEMELRSGLILLERSDRISASDKKALKENVFSLLGALAIVPFDSEAVFHALRIQKAAMEQGRTLSFVDACIAGQAISIGATLVSHDKKAFQGFLLEEFDWEDWME